MTGSVLILVPAAAAGVAAAAWLGLLLAPPRPWDLRPVGEDEPRPPEPPSWPRVGVVVPARNEARLLPATLPALLGQDYPGEWHALLVDDRSDDETAEVAIRLGTEAAALDRLTVLRGAPLPDGWAGKVWALEQGARAATAHAPDYLLLTDADIRHAPGSLRRLVAESEAAGLSLNSRMARLRCVSGAERLLIPPFVFFFNLLYPMRLVNDQRRRIAAAAGGCVLVRVDALERAGGLASIRGEVIDDVNLARRVKGAGGPIRLSTSRADVESMRVYGSVRAVWRMVRRTAFDELGYSLVLLALTIVGLAVLFLLPPLALLAGGSLAAARGAHAVDVSWGACALLGGLGLAAWAVATVVYRPSTRFFGLPARVALTLPVAGMLYGGMTLDSARAHVRGARRTW